MKESKKILRNLVKLSDKENESKAQLQLPKKYREAIRKKYKSVEEFEQAVADLHEEVLKQERG